MKLKVISSPAFFEGEAKIINQLFEAGMSCFHLRKSRPEKAAYLSLLRQINPVYHDRIALHQFHEVAQDMGISRLHFPEYLRPLAQDSIAVLHKDFTLSTSTHKISQLTDLKYFNYTFYGPVFHSISKKGYLSTCQNDFRLPLNTPLQVIALGGVSASRIEQLKAMNFEGAAILGCLWTRSDNALQTFQAIQEKCRAVAAVKTVNGYGND
ncbi:putative thiamine phosphate pyrophosphorylase [Pedobacter sp. BAL39]|uniref:thiamine phosphate synthase n=1 Tax=Pedobacter sp. BAL39 TaxID=391596 RepID=UPI0001559DFB|nr:thiamine phosphate synthase [Pedobacter sp. BAL39]EDM36775.1 putative thiamine phosphate pyrophosphorylase [Pedobacter sp. BAL39]